MTRMPIRGLGLFGLLGIVLALPAEASDTVVYYLTDTLHSTVVVTDAQRNVIETTHYAPYGQVLNRSLRNGPGYGGHEEDAATGLVYMQQRYYDPESGRFLSADPVQTDGDGGSFNRYAYANDNPYRYTDPDGRCADGTCDAMVQNYAAYANAHPSTELSPLAKVGLTVMLSASGVDEVALAGKVLGGESKAFKAIEKATGKAVDTSKAERFETTVKVGGEQVTVRGSVVDHQVKIGTAFVKKKPER